MGAILTALLTQGLSSSSSKSSSGDWRPIVLERMRGRYDIIATSSSTAQAEAGLQIGANSYWFVGRVIQLYGRVLMVWAANEESEELSHFRFTPFDTGGLWSGDLEAQPQFVDGVAKRAYLSSMTCDAVTMCGMFHEWIASAFNRIDEYVAGVGPPTWSLCDRLAPSKENSFSWSWEGRREKTQLEAGEGFRLEKIFWARSDLTEFRVFIRNSISNDDAYAATVGHLASVSVVDDNIDESRKAARRYLGLRLATP